MLPLSGKLHCRKHYQSGQPSTKELCPRHINQHCGHSTSHPKDFMSPLNQKRKEETQDGSCEFRVTSTLKTYAGPRQKHSIMGPHQLKVCRICFAMDCQLHLLIGNVKLYKGYEAITGLTLADEEDLPPYLCSSCADQLMNCARFRHRSLQAHLMLLDILKKHDHISLEIIQNVLEIQTTIDYDTVIEHTPNEITVRNDKKRSATADGINKEISDLNKQSDIPVISIKTEIDESNENTDSNINKIKTENIEMNMECEEINVDSVKIENNDVNKDCDNITSINRVKTKVYESNKECVEGTNVYSIKRDVDDVNKKCEGIASACVKARHEKDCEKTTINNINTKYNQSNKDGGFNESRINTNISHIYVESGEIAVNKMKSKIIDFNEEREEIIKPNKIKTEIDDVGVKYNDISIEIIKNEVNDEIYEIPNKITANDDNFPSPNTYEVAVVPSLGINDIVEPNALDDESVSNDIDDRQMDTGDGVLDGGLPLEQEDKLKTVEEREGIEVTNDNLLQEREEHFINDNSCEICDKNSERNSSSANENKCACLNSDLSKSNVDLDSDKPFKCNVCKKKFTRKGSLVVHLRVHDEDNPFLCNICKKSFTRQTNLDDHMRLHSGDRPFMCDKCRKTYIRKSSLEEHLLNHEGKKPFMCTVCKKAFTRKNGLDEHFRIHSGDKPFICSVCAKAFSRKRRLEEHMRKHSTDNPLFCDICKKSFTRKSNLEEHLRNHAGVKPFLCKLCKKAFTRKSSMLEHVRTHSGHKPFLCKICKKSFTRKNNLDDHLRTHTGNKPYKCDVCDKSFCLNGNLQKHMMIHYGDKPYPCNLCDNFFRQKSHLQRHLLTHSTEQVTTP